MGGGNGTFQNRITLAGELRRAAGVSGRVTQHPKDGWGARRGKSGLAGIYVGVLKNGWIRVTALKRNGPRWISDSNYFRGMANFGLSSRLCGALMR